MSKKEVCCDKNGEYVVSKRHSLDENEIMVDFEGRCPVSTDYHGIKNLLDVVFPRSQIDTGALCDIIISQSIGCALKQCEAVDLEESDSHENPENEMEFDSDFEVYGINTIISLDSNLPAIVSLKQFLLQKYASECMEDTTKKLFEEVLNESKGTALVVNSRLVNIPTQVALPFFTSLQTDIEEAENSALIPKLNHYIFVSSILKSDVSKKESKRHLCSEDYWINEEEKQIGELAVASFDFSVVSDRGKCVSGQWSDDDVGMTPHRRVLLLSSTAFKKVVRVLAQRKSVL